jgi:hypothetical protein
VFLLEALALILDEPCATLGAEGSAFLATLNRATTGRRIAFISDWKLGMEKLDWIWRLSGS